MMTILTKIIYQSQLLKRINVTMPATIILITMLTFVNNEICYGDNNIQQKNAAGSALPTASLGFPKADTPLKASPGVDTLEGKISHPLTIDEVTAMALSVNKTLSEKVESLLQVQGQTTVSRSGLGPTVSSSYIYTHNTNCPANSTGGSFNQGGNTGQWSASLNLPLDIFGKLHAIISQSQYNEIAAKLEINRVRNEIVLDVKNAFYNVLRNQALVKVAEINLQNASDRLSDVELRLSAGTASRYDVISARSTFAGSRQTLIKSRNALNLALATLNSTIGIDINTPLTLTTEGAVDVPKGDYTITAQPSKATASIENNLPDSPVQSLGDQGASQVDQIKNFVVTDTIKLNSDYDALLKEALQKRPEVLREEANVAAAKKGLTVARAASLPTVSAGYSLSNSQMDGNGSSSSTTGEATLSVSFPLYDAGSTRGKVQQAKAAAASSETIRRSQIDTVTLEVRQVYLNMKLSKEAVLVARQELAESDEAYRLASLRYSSGVTKQSGVSPIVELSDAQKALSQSQSDYINALYDYNYNRSALDKAVGRYAYTPNGPGYVSATEK